MVITAPIGSQCRRSSFSTNSDVKTPWTMKPKTPMAVITPASGGGYFSTVSTEVKPLEKPYTVTYAVNHMISRMMIRRT